MTDETKKENEEEQESKITNLISKMVRKVTPMRKKRKLSENESIL